MSSQVVIANRYEVLHSIGRGGMGEVFEALDRQTRRRVAVKLLDIGNQPSLADEAAARFRRELLATAQLATRHAVGVHDGGIDDNGRAFMVMDLLVGEDLEHVLARKPRLPVELALRIVAQASDGLAVAHGLGIIHRDIKPSNLFLVEPNERGTRIVKILDFGVARMDRAVLAHELTELTQTGAMVGSPTYMSPEQLRGSKQLDHRSDLWSLGAVLYRAVSGSLPHEAATFGDLIVQVCSTPAPPLRDRVPEVSRELSELVDRLLAIDPADRIPSAAVLSQELARWLPEGREIEERLFEAPVPEPRPAPQPGPSTAPNVAAARSPSGLDHSGARSGFDQVPEQRPAPAVAKPSAPPRPTRAPPEGVYTVPLPPVEQERSRSWGKFLVLLVLLAVLAVVGQRALREYRRSREIPEPTLSPPSDMLDGLPPNLASTDGAIWFKTNRGQCNAMSLDHLLTSVPPPANDHGIAFAAACAVMAGNLALARLRIASAEDPKFASWPTFAVAHPLADQRNGDRLVADIMRLVLEFWPENFLANYHAGIAEFIVRDPRAERHLGAVLQYYPQEDEFKDTARKLLTELKNPGDPSCDRIVVIDPEGHRIRPPGCPP